MNRIPSAALLLWVSLTLGSCGGPSGGCSASVPAGPLGNPAPNFILENLSGEKVELASLVRDKPALLVFWATWCPTCIEEIPVLNEWVEKYPELRILGINYQEPRDRLRPFAEKRGIRYPILLDLEGEVAQQYGLVGIPAVVLVAQGGQVIYYGFSLPQDIDKLVAL